jgi:hypothetical protein
VPRSATEGRPGGLRQDRGITWGGTRIGRPRRLARDQGRRPAVHDPDLERRRLDMTLKWRSQILISTPPEPRPRTSRPRPLLTEARPAQLREHPDRRRPLPPSTSSWSPAREPPCLRDRQDLPAPRRRAQAAVILVREAELALALVGRGAVGVGLREADVDGDRAVEIPDRALRVAPQCEGMGGRPARSAVVGTILMHTFYRRELLLAAATPCRVLLRRPTERLRLARDLPGEVLRGAARRPA